MSTYKRVNTIKINFDPAATRPAALEIHHWLVNYIGLNIDQVYTVQLNSRERAIYVKLTIDPPTGRSAYKSNISGNNHPVTSNDKSMEKMDTLSSSGMIQESTQNDLQLETQEGKERAKQQEQLIPEYKIERAVGVYLWKGHLYKVNRLQIRNDYKQGGLRLTAVNNKAQAIMMRHFITTLHGQVIQRM
ncbi:hypothetical protein ANN_10970 [Periplaneta americana]|uniref:Uncharacterized protein n=1 Tax=Periplaneta americana TaxID=6978 RepID=A0ABQ8T610_PERAM|nr:hypothetical protein ANN_10970 [Periplaneta americana]